MGKPVVVAAGKAVDLIADAHNHRQHQQVQAHSQQRIADLDGRAAEDTDADHHQQKTGAAPGMEPGHGPHVLHGQGQSSLIAADGFMFRAVIAEHPLHVLHLGHQNHVPHKNNNFQQALHQISGHMIIIQAGNQAADQGRQQNEQAHRQTNAQNCRRIDDKLFQFFRTEMLFNPAFQLGRLAAAALLLGKILGGKQQRPNAVDHGAAKRENTADERDSGQRGALFGQLQIVDLFHQTVLGADHNGLFIGAPHKDALNQGLSADQCFELLTAALCFLLFCHGCLLRRPGAARFILLLRRECAPLPKCRRRRRFPGSGTRRAW